MVEKSEPISVVSSKGLFPRAIAFGLVKLWSWLTPPLVAVATLLLAMALYDISMRDYYQNLAVIAFLVTFFVFREIETAHPRDPGSFKTNTSNLLLAWVLIFAILLLIGYVTKHSHLYSRLVLFTWFSITPLPLLLAQILLNRLNVALVQSTGNTRRVVVAGVTEISQKLVSQFVQDGGLATDFIGYFEDRNAERIGPIEHGRVLGELSDLAEYVRENNIDVIYVTLPIRHLERSKKLLDELHDTTASIYFVPDIFVFDLIQARTYEVNGIPTVSLCETPFVGISGLLKHVSDFVIACIALILITPLLILISIGVKLTSKGPVFFKQRRYGLDGHEIIVYKFRTMRVIEDGDEVIQAKRNDPRVTKVGAFLRKYSLDELPQFINVLQGRMSVVGPRPHAVAHNEIYRKVIKGYMIRHKVLPGITGLAQVNGFRGETSEVEQMEKRIEYDLEYLRHWSLLLDLQIIFKTVLTVAKSNKDVY